MPKTIPKPLEITDPEMKKWDNLLRIGEEARAEKLDGEYRDNLRYLSGQQLFQGNTAIPITQNIYGMTERTMVAALYARNPKPRVYAELSDLPNPKDEVAREAWKRDKRERERQAKINQALLVKADKEGGLEDAGRRMTQGMIVGCRSAILIGYGAVFGEETGKGDKTKYTVAKARGKSVGLSPDATVKASKVMKERLWYRALTQEDFFYDAAAMEMDDSPWLAVDQDVPLDYVKNNENFDKDVREKVAAWGSLYQESFLKGARAFNAENYKLSNIRSRGFPKEAYACRLRTVYDLAGKKVRTYAVGSEGAGWLEEKPYNFKRLEGYPVVEGTFNPSPKDQWSKSELSRLRGVQDQMNRLDKQIADYQRVLISVILADNGVLQDDDVEKFMKSEFMELFLVNPGKGNIRFFESTGVILQNLLARRRDLWDIYTRESHLPEWRTMGQRMGARSAEEASAIKEGFSSFVNEKIYRVEKVLEKVYTKSLQMIHDLYTKKHAVTIMGELGEEWAQFDPETAREELSVGVVPYSSLPATPQMELERTKTWLQISAQTTAAAPGLVKIGVVLHDAAEQLMPGRDVERYFNTAMLEQLMTDEDMAQKLGMSLAQIQPEGVPGATGPQGFVGGQQFRPLEAPPL